MSILRKWWFYLILLLIGIAIVAFIATQPVHAQPDPAQPQVQVPEDVQALTSQLSNAGCNAALNAASAEIIKLRKQVAELQAAQTVGKSGATKH